MNKNEMIAQIADKAGITRAKAVEAVEAFFECISAALAAGEEVRLVGFGTFYVTHSAAREGRNPRTGDTIKIKASVQPKFKPGKALKDSTNVAPKKKAA